MYRSDTVIRKSWDVVDKEVPHDSDPAILYFVGDGQVFYNVFVLAGSTPLALNRNYTQVRRFPVVVYDMKNLAYFVCTDHPEHRRIPADRIYAWEVRDTMLIPIHDKVRQDIASWCMVK
jgi:hypothetical protein